MDLLAWMEQWDMLPSGGGTILCALSGGRDSVCLLHYLHELSRKQNFSVAAAHFNHQMRPSADAEEEFCRTLCRDWDVPFYAGRGDVYAAARENGWSGEEAARRLRYAFLEQTAHAIGAKKIATAHHLSDQAETVLLNLLRGSGTEGLCGIPPVRGNVIRPLLETGRQEIEAYLSRYQLSYVDDESNESDSFSRNRLRLDVWPELERIHPGCGENIARAARILRQEESYLKALAQERMPPSGTEIDCGVLLNAPEALQMRMLRLLVERTGAGRKDFGAIHYEALLTLAKSGGALDLPGGLQAVCREGVLRLQEKKSVPAAKWLKDVTCWGDYTIYCRKTSGNFLQKEDTIALNCGKINQLPQVRAMQGGDRLTLPGSRGSRSVKRLLTERGIPAEQRLTIPVLCVGERVAAVYGVGTDCAFVPQEGGEAWEITITKTLREDM